jgi:hypothetical protein
MEIKTETKKETKSKTKIKDQIQILENVNSVESVAWKDLIVGHKYIFCYNDVNCFADYMIGELSKMKIKNNKSKDIEEVQFKSYARIDQLVPVFRGSTKFCYKIFIINSKRATHAAFYTLNYSNYLESLK